MLETGVSVPEWADICLRPVHTLAAHWLLWAAARCCRCTGACSIWRFSLGAPVHQLIAEAGPKVPLLLPALGYRVDMAAGALSLGWQ